MERPENNIVDNILVDDLVDVPRFQGDADYALKLVRKAARKAACETDVQRIHDLSRAIKVSPLMVNLRPIGKRALVDAVKTGNKAAVRALITEFDLTVADVRSVKAIIVDQDLTDCLCRVEEGIRDSRVLNQFFTRLLFCLGVGGLACVLSWIVRPELIVDIMMLTFFAVMVCMVCMMIWMISH